jgi:hypothetical protein
LANPKPKDFPMKKSRFTDSQIAFILRQAEEGKSVEEVCRKAGISAQTYYRWRNKYGGLDGTPLNPPGIKTGTELIPPKVDAPTTEVYPGNSGVDPQLPGGTSLERDAKDYTTVTPIPDQKGVFDYLFLNKGYVPPPAGKLLPGYPDAEYIGNITDRAPWKNGRERLQWDYETGAIERYSQTGKHIGEFSPDGKQLKAPNPNYKYNGK